MICRPRPAALAFAFALGAPLASCGGGPKGRPTLPPPDYEAPSASPDASTPPVPGAANPGSAASAGPGASAPGQATPASPSTPAR